jgi:hypothetical protein
MIVCSIPDCGKPICNKRGWCGTHYERWRQHGDPSIVLKPGNGVVLAFLNDVVMAFHGKDCLVWPYCRAKGYGQIGIEGKTRYVHRVVCIRAYGPPPSPRHEAAHRCGNGHLGCCNQDHLWWATPAENQRDKIAHGTYEYGENNPNFRLTTRDVIEIRSLAGSLSKKEIASRFGVSRRTVNHIHNGTSWSWLL